MIELFSCFAIGFIIGLFAYTKGYRAQSPFYKENK
tara:strand:- start:470 stop:574 length:105 start_codon:yes stop_codon:yes gene_type:complete